MSDLISRQAAIDALGEKPLAWTEGEYELGLQQQWEADVNAIKALPSAERKGTWIIGKDVPNRNPYEHLADAMYCSECLTEAYWDCDYGQQMFDFCPYCGAKMERKES